MCEFRPSKKIKQETKKYIIINVLLITIFYLRILHVLVIFLTRFITFFIAPYTFSMLYFCRPKRSFIIIIFILFYFFRRTAKRHKRTYRTIGVFTLWTGTQQREHWIRGDDAVRDSTFSEMVPRGQQDISVLGRPAYNTATQGWVHG